MTADKSVNDQLKGWEGTGLRQSANLHGENPVLVLDRPEPAPAAPEDQSCINVREDDCQPVLNSWSSICGEIITMPGLPKVPSAYFIDAEDGKIVGLLQRPLPCCRNKKGPRKFGPFLCWAAWGEVAPQVVCQFAKIFRFFLSGLQTESPQSFRRTPFAKIFRFFDRACTASFCTFAVGSYPLRSRDRPRSRGRRPNSLNCKELAMAMSTASNTDQRARRKPFASRRSGQPGHRRDRQAPTQDH